MRQIKKEDLDLGEMIRTEGARMKMFSVAAIARATGIPETTLRKKLKRYKTLSAGELSALMKECPTITDEMMGKAIRAIAK
jgi:DNA-binding transcriptional regulator PaaX